MPAPRTTPAAIERAITAVKNQGLAIGAVVVARDGTIRIWSVERGSALRATSCGACLHVIAKENCHGGDWVTCVRFSPVEVQAGGGGNNLISCGWDKKLNHWHVPPPPIPRTCPANRPPWRTGCRAATRWRPNR